jgi:hypothetical protein
MAIDSMAKERFIKNQQFKLSEGLLQRITRMQEVEIRKLGYPLARAEVMRKCLTLGLDTWEAGQKGARG